MTSNGEKKPETVDKPHQFERKPKPNLPLAIGQIAVNGAQKDKGKK